MPNSTTPMQGWCPWCANHMLWGGWWMMLLWLIAILAVGWLAWSFTRRSQSDLPSEQHAEALLKERYARGEIDEPTYRHMLDELRR